MEQQHPGGSEEVATKLALEGQDKCPVVGTLPSESLPLLTDTELDKEKGLNHQLLELAMRDESLGRVKARAQWLLPLELEETFKWPSQAHFYHWS